MDKIKEVYDKFKHLDKILSDKSITEDSMDNFRYKILKELWEAIKHHATTEMCEFCKGYGEVWEAPYPIYITCQKCKGEGRIEIKPTLKAEDPILTTNIKNQKTIKVEE